MAGHDRVTVRFLRVVRDGLSASSGPPGAGWVVSAWGRRPRGGFAVDPAEGAAWGA